MGYEAIAKAIGESDEWQDGDDSKLYDTGYSEGVRDALEYIRDELGFDFHDSDIIERLGVI